MNFREYLEKMRIGEKEDKSVEHYDEYDFLNAPREINDYHQFSQNIGAEESGRITPEYIANVINRQMTNDVIRNLDTFDILSKTTDALGVALYHLNELHNLGFEIELLDILRNDIETELKRREHGDDYNYRRVS